jgi:hypothetical protein
VSMLMWGLRLMLGIWVFGFLIWWFEPPGMMVLSRDDLREMEKTFGVEVKLIKL